MCNCSCPEHCPHSAHAETSLSFEVYWPSYDDNVRAWEAQRKAEIAALREQERQEREAKQQARALVRARREAEQQRRDEAAQRARQLDELRKLEAKLAQAAKRQPVAQPTERLERKAVPLSPLKSPRKSWFHHEQTTIIAAHVRTEDLPPLQHEFWDPGYYAKHNRPIQTQAKREAMQPELVQEAARRAEQLSRLAEPDPESSWRARQARKQEVIDFFRGLHTAYLSLCERWEGG